MTAMEEREAFEAGIARDRQLPLEQSATRYDYDITNTAWRYFEAGWQARASRDRTAELETSLAEANAENARLRKGLSTILVPQHSDIESAEDYAHYVTGIAATALDLPPRTAPKGSSDE